MNNTKKIVKMLSLALISVFAITGCTTSKSYTFDVSTGDKIKVELQTNDGYDISSNLPFEISKDGNILSQGTFITIDGYNQYVDIANDTSSGATVLDEGNKNGVTYTFYSYNNEEFNYIIKVDNSNTGVLLGNDVSEQSAKEVFEKLTFSKE